MRRAAYKNDKVLRWLLATQDYTFRVEEIPGRENLGADFMSRTAHDC
jgi:hypothetical protein